nr:ribonuclease H-like domain-containing protein [Tanacetum cinerariifolium]
MAKVECYNCHRKGHFVRESSDNDNWSPSNLYDRFVPSGGYHSVPPPMTGTFMPRKPDLVFHTPLSDETEHLAFNDRNFHAKKLTQKSYASMDTHKHHAQMHHSRIPLHKVTTAARTISAARQTFSKTRPYIAPYAVSKSKAPIRRPFIRHTSPKSSISPPRGNPQEALQDKGVIDSGCSRHMTGNMSYLSDFKELNEGYVAFGGNPKGGKITGKGKIKTGKLDFDDVFYVKELKFNLFSVSQMCDKKNNVLFTDTECLVLSSDFKLPDATQVLLRVPRENNMHNVNLKNIIPSGDLTCLFANATLDESNLW